MMLAAIRILFPADNVLSFKRPLLKMSIAVDDLMIKD